MAENGDQEIEDTSMDEEQILNMMRKSLPPYVVNCFKYTGYDNSPAITQMTTEGPQNSLNQIEGFIIKYHPNDEFCYPPTVAKNLTNVPNFVFLPGHRILIAKFINDFKAREEINSRLARKRPTTGHSNATKKRIITCSTADPEESPPYQSYDLQFHYNDIRKRMVKWIRKEGSKEIQELKEHTDYSVICKLDSSDHLKASVKCTLCRKEFQLNPKTTANGKKVMILSNWTAHIKQCIHKCKDSGKQPGIATFLQQSQPHQSDPSTISNDQQRKCVDHSANAGKLSNDDSCMIQDSIQAKGLQQNIKTSTTKLNTKKRSTAAGMTKQKSHQLLAITQQSSPLQLSPQGVRQPTHVEVNTQNIQQSPPVLVTPQKDVTQHSTSVPVNPQKVHQSRPQGTQQQSPPVLVTPQKDVTQHSTSVPVNPQKVHQSPLASVSPQDTQQQSPPVLVTPQKDVTQHSTSVPVNPQKVHQSPLASVSPQDIQQSHTKGIQQSSTFLSEKDFQ